MKILIFGKTGQIGTALNECKNICSVNSTIKFVDRQEFDLHNIELIQAYLSKEKPDIIINAAAFTNVNLSETQRMESCILNSFAPKEMALYANKNKILLIHYSTDYVFGDTKTLPYEENDKRMPLNYYGTTKSAGESFLEDCGNSIILRLSWVYGQGENFVKTIYKLSKNKEEITVVNDQIGSLSWANDIATATYQIINKIAFQTITKNIGTQIYHLCNQGYNSWYDVACYIVNFLKDHNIEVKVKNIIPITSLDYQKSQIDNIIANRPHNSKLLCNKIKNTYDIILPHWQESLEQFLVRNIAFL